MDEKRARLSNAILREEIEVNAPSAIYCTGPFIVSAFVSDAITEVSASTQRERERALFQMVLNNASVKPCQGRCVTR